jgi:hypothetical protein
MFGKLSLNVIPHETIAAGGALSMVLAALTVSGWVKQPLT